MRIPAGLTSALALAALLGACARNPRPATPAPQAAPTARQPATSPAPAAAPAPTAPAPDLAGEWEFTSNIGDGTVSGTLTLTRAGGTYAGSARGHDGGVFPLTSLTFVAGKVVMVFDTPDGAARVESTLTSANEMSGTVVLGETMGTFAARKK